MNKAIFFEAAPLILKVTWSLRHDLYDYDLGMKVLKFLKLYILLRYILCAYYEPFENITIDHLPSS